MRRKAEYRVGLEERALLDKAQAAAAQEIAIAIPKASGCIVSIERIPTQALRVKILKEGLRLNNAEFDTAGDIVHRLLAPVRALRYGEPPSEEALLCYSAKVQ